MPNITKLSTIVDFNDTTTFVVINNGTTKRLAYKDVKDKLADELGTILGGGGAGGGGGSSIGLNSRTSIVLTTTALAQNVTGSLIFTGYKAYALLKIETNEAAWVRIYTSSQAQAEDFDRSIGNDPTPGSGVIAEIITNGARVQPITPAAIGFNNNTPIDDKIYCAVTNLNSGSQSLTITLTLLQLEA